MNLTVTLIAQIIVFAILVWFVNAVLWGPLTNLMEQRRQRIADGLAAAERGQHAQELAEERASKLLQEAKEKASEIIAQAQRRASEIVEESKDTARTEGERLLAAANAEIEKEVNRAREELRGQVVSIAVTGAGKVLKKELDPKAHEVLLKDLVAQL